MARLTRLSLVCLLIRLVLTWFVILAVGAFQEYYQQDLLSNYSASTVSWIPSLQIFFIMGLVSLLLSCHGLPVVNNSC